MAYYLYSGCGIWFPTRKATKQHIDGKDYEKDRSNCTGGKIIDDVLYEDFPGNPKAKPPPPSSTTMPEASAPSTTKAEARAPSTSAAGRGRGKGRGRSGGRGRSSQTASSTPRHRDDANVASVVTRSRRSTRSQPNFATSVGIIES